MIDNINLLRVVLLIASLLCSCGPSIQEKEDGLLEAMKKGDWEYIQNQDDVPKDILFHRRLNGGWKDQHINLIRILIQRGAEICINNDYNNDQLSNAIHEKQLGLIKFYLDHGASRQGNRLQKAIRTGNVAVVETLLNNGVSITTEDGAANPLMFAIKRFKELESMTRTADKHKLYEVEYNMIRCLLSHGADANTTLANGKSVLNSMCWDEKWETARLLLEHNASVSDDDISAVICRLPEYKWMDGYDYKFDLMKDMISKTHDCNKTKFLHSAILSGSTNAIEYFLKQGANINATNSSGYTPLESTLNMMDQRNVYKVVEFLIKNGATVNLPGRSLLSRYNYRSSDLKNMLIRYGAR